MKTRIITALCFGGWLLACVPATDLKATGPIVAHSRTSELTASTFLLPVGTPRHAFLKQIGPPDDQLSDDIWIYWNRRTNQPRLSEGFDTLLVTFHRDRVSQLRIVADAPVRKLIAERDRRNPGALLRKMHPALRSR
jgi:hypothetical protein